MFNTILIPFVVVFLRLINSLLGLEEAVCCKRRWCDFFVLAVWSCVDWSCAFIIVLGALAVIGGDNDDDNNNDDDDDDDDGNGDDDDDDDDACSKWHLSPYLHFPSLWNDMHIFFAFVLLVFSW